MKNIALLIPSLTIGGSERSVSNISLALQEHFNVKVVVFSESNNVYRHGGNLINLNCPSEQSKYKKILNVFKRTSRLNKVLKKEKIDILYSFTGTANIVCCLSSRKCKKLISCRGFGDLQGHEKLYKNMLKFTDGIVFNSKELKNHFDNFCSNKIDKTYSLYNIFYTDENKKNNSVNIPKHVEEFISKHITVVTVGRFCEEKGYDSLIKAFCELKRNVNDAGLLFIGDGPLMPEIKQLAKESQYEQDILFYGFSNSPKEVIELCDIYALSSNTEGFPNALIEAMQCGLPIVSTNCQTGPSEILSDNFNKSIDKFVEADYGILTPVFSKKSEKEYEKSIKEFANALEILAKNEDIRKKYSQLARYRAKNYEEKYIISEYINLINKL